MSLLRYQVFIAYAIVFFSLWLIALQRNDKQDLPPFCILLIQWAPVWAVLSVGVYLLFVLVSGVLDCKDCPEAAAELDLEIDMARRELRKRRII
jgi:hypothetical protein